jgi:hypothetical protein
MKKKQPRKTRDSGRRQQAAPGAKRPEDAEIKRPPNAPVGPVKKEEEEERKIGVISGTPADAFDETEERKHNKVVAIYISVLAVLLAIAATGSNDAMKIAQQSGFQVNDLYAFYQAKTIRQSQIKIASDELQLKMDETPNLDSLPEPARKFLQTTKADYDKEVVRLESNARNGKKELLAKAESCENERNVALAQHPFYDYSMAMLQIAIVLASASIIMGSRLLIHGSRAVGALGILFFLNGYALFFGGPELKHDKADALEKAGVHISLKCLEG